ncbi:MAG: type I glyceraldehyde-3-phosphate dehydrogenase [Verrucomicrobiae bacterium]|nr:type I glyceraldehyde-3-phosphate dehydrogenase [Verrucomicrobiae bacterium]
MSIRLAIHPFDRCGRLILRILVERGLLSASNGVTEPPIILAAVSDQWQPEGLAHLLRHDSTYGPFPGMVEAVGDEAIAVNGLTIPFVESTLRFGSERSLPWGDLGVTHVIENQPERLPSRRSAVHIESGAHKVLAAGHSGDDAVTLVMGVNHDRYDPSRHHVVSAALPTLTATGPILKVLNDSFGVDQGLLTHLRAYMTDLGLLDTAISGDRSRRCRAAAINVIPANRGYLQSLAWVLPELTGKLHSHAFFVPSQAVSVLDLCVRLVKNTTVEEIHAALREAAAGPAMHGILDLSDEPLVSRDFLSCPASCTVDTGLTQMLGGDFVKLVAWHDAEWAYACRVVDVLRWMLVAEGEM